MLNTYEIKFINKNGLFIDVEYFVAQTEPKAYRMAREYYPNLIISEINYISKEDV